MASFTRAAGVGADALVVGAVGRTGLTTAQAVLLAEAEVVLAERDRRVHEPGPVLGAHEVARQHGVAALAELLAGDVGNGGS